MATAPFARQVDTIIGSISGVRPTAIEMAKSAADIQLPFVNPLIKNTMGTMTSIKRMSTHEIELIPFSKLVSGGAAESSFAMLPNRVSFPVVIMIPEAVPLMTLLPIKARFGASVNAPFSV